MFGAKYLYIFLGLIFTDSKSGKILTPNDLKNWITFITIYVFLMHSQQV